MWFPLWFAWLSVGEEVFVRLWSDYPGPAIEVVFFEELTRVARGGFDFFKLGLSEGDEARFAVVHCGIWVVGFFTSREAFLW